ncbi:ABC transporter permease [Paenibacillus rhizoplanae]
MEVGKRFAQFILIKSTYDPPLAEGRFFNDADFFYNNDNLAVIGKNIDGTDLLEKKRMSFIILFAGRSYKVIGIMGASYSSKLDNTVLVNLDSLQSDSFMDSTVYVMNIAHSPITSDLKLPLLQNDLPIHVFDRGDSGTVRAMDIGTQQLMVTFIFIILLFSTSVISAFFG